MKTLNLLLKSLFFSMVFFSISLFAVSNSCDGTPMTPVHGATSDASYSDTENSTGNGGYSGYYRFRPQVDGTVRIRVDQMNSKRQRIYIGTSCRAQDIFYSQTNSGIDTTFNVTANQWYYIRIRERNNQDRIRYRIRVDLTANSTSPSCATLRDSDNLTNTNTSYTNAGNYNQSDWNVGPNASGGTLSRAYHFTVDGPGTVDIDLTRIDRNQASFSVAKGTCPATLDDLKSTQLTFTAAGDFYVYIYYINGQNTNIEHQLDVVFTPPAVATANPDTYSTQVNTQLVVLPVDGVLSNDTGTGISITGADLTGLAGTIDTYDANTGAFTFTPTANFSGQTTFQYTITDSSSNTSFTTVTINVQAPNINAVDDSYNTEPNVPVSGNLLTNDTGTSIEVTSNTQPTQGTVIIQANGTFTYTPNQNASGTDTFTYTITDSFGSTATATVTITIGTSFSNGQTTPFVLVNPDYARNVIGNYEILGNTVLCLTEKTTGFGGTCHGDNDYQSVTSNNHVVRYIDIDNNGGTWNSTSSYIDFGSTAYDPTRGIIWAGLFWGGRISTNNDHPKRYAVPDGANSFDTVDVQGLGTFDITTTGATTIKLKVDNGSYNDVTAAKFHDSDNHTYSAYADVSSILQASALNKGKHVFTVANLTTMEGREGSPGAFGGWSLVIIYAEDYEFGSPKNISIYNGFIDIGENDAPIKIEGFKLPKTGDVEAKISIFSGEGEYLYGPDDWMKISNQETSGYGYLDPAASNKNNMFDSKMTGISRDKGSTGDMRYNALGTNNVGVEVDSFDISTLMTTYRTNDENINTVYIQTYSDWDYITTSMIAFSAELYVPKLCYDYTLDIDGYVLDSVDNIIKTPFGNYGKPLTSVLYIKSLEGDIPLSNVDVNYTIHDTSQVTYSDCTTEISETGEYDYSDACPYTHGASDTGFGMYIGTGKTASSGGVINGLESRYIKFDSDFHTANVNTSFEFSIGYNVDYGAGAVPLRKTFTSADLCPPSTNGFLPELGFFNVTDGANDIDEWNLFTQVSRRAFNLKLYAHSLSNGDYITPIGQDLNLSVEVELIRADNFNRDANTACNDEHSKLNEVPSKFLHFNEGRDIDFSYEADDVNFAYRSVAARVWYLTDADGNGTVLDDHNCSSINQNACEKLYTRAYNSSTICQAECSAGSTGCYDCLRTTYGRKVCSRDNFAIRPESFLTDLFDSDQNDSTLVTSNHIANSTTTSNEFAVVAGYKYRFDINSTNHVDNVATPRYIQHFEPGSPTHYVNMAWNPDGHVVTGCNDVEDKNITLNIFNGSTVNPITNISYVDKVDQIGKYKFGVYDQNWTSADWANLAHHKAPINANFTDYSAYYIDGPDCIKDSHIVSLSGTAGKSQGCVISSEHENLDTSVEYKYLYAQYYPYAFDITDLNNSYGARPTNDKSTDTYLYINTPGLDANGVDKNMSYNIQGTFTASGYPDRDASPAQIYGDPVSNFVDNCYAESVDMTLHQNYNHAIPAIEDYLTYDLIDYNTSNSAVVIRPRPASPVTFSTANNANDPLIVTQNKQFFVKDMEASITMDLGYNFNRTMNTTLNPRHIHMRDFNITYATAALPATIYVDLITDHKIFGNLDLDQNVSFVYGRAKPNKFFYDNVTAGNVITPVSVVAYCDLGLLGCQNRGLGVMAVGLLSDAQTNESSWWYSQTHSTADDADGKVTLVASGGGTVAPTDPTSITTANGIDNNVLVTNTGGTPNIVDIDFGPNTDFWLIYNKDANAIPSPFYRVRFIGASGWTGRGQTGHVVGDNINQKKSRRLEW